eukprot:2344435-Pyramimonas_sp.AAC.2
MRPPSRTASGSSLLYRLCKATTSAMCHPGPPLEVCMYEKRSLPEGSARYPDSRVLSYVLFDRAYIDNAN